MIIEVDKNNIIVGIYLGFPEDITNISDNNFIEVENLNYKIGDVYNV